MYNSDKLIPAKFLTLVAHFAISVTLLWSSRESVKICLPESHTVESFNSHHTQLVTGLSLSLSLIMFELLVFVTGLTMFHSTSALLSIGSHGSACFLLSYLVFGGWQCGWYWIIFALFSVLPPFYDAIIIGDIVLYKKY